MLVLSRKPGEKLVIARDITVTVLEMKGNRVRIGIEAPAQVPIRRQELCDPRVEPFIKEERQSKEMLHAVGNA